MVQRIWIVSELYYPEQTSTGHFITQTAEDLASHYPVKVLCGQPNYASRGQRAPNKERRNGVDIHRCWSTTFNKNNLFLRLLNALTFSLSVLITALRKFNSDDCVFVVTNPPTLPIIINLVCRLKKARYILIVHDVYPEVLVATGKLSKSSAIVRLINWVITKIYRDARKIVVLGRDMKQLIQKKLPDNERRIHIIENWADLDLVDPLPRSRNRLLSELSLNDHFVVLYLGNIGRTHGIEVIVRCAQELTEERYIHFLFIGEGAKKKWLEQTLIELALPNVTVMDRIPYSELSMGLNAGDVSLISFVSGMAGVSVPSRMYNFMAAGNPILAVADPDAELSQVVTEQGIGWVVQPNDAGAIRAVILDAAADRKHLVEMGRRSREAAVNKYSRERASQSYLNLVKRFFEDQT